MAIQLDRNDKERKELRARADEIALKWATRPSEDFSSHGIRGEAAALLLACKKPDERGILADSFQEAADICDNGRAVLMRGIAEQIKSGTEIKIGHFLEGFDRC